MNSAGEGDGWRVVASRLQSARDRLGLSLGDCSSQLGIPVSTLASYTSGKVPLPVQTGLQFCRQFVVGEEWLAGIDAADDDRSWRGPDAYEALRDVPHFRRFVGLISHPLALSIPRSMPYGDAFSEVLSKAYKELAVTSGELPAVPFSEYPELELLRNYMDALIDVFVFSVGFDSITMKGGSWWGGRNLAIRLREIWPLLRAGLAGSGQPRIPGPEWLYEALEPRGGGPIPELLLPGLGHERQSSVDNERIAEQSSAVEWETVAWQLRQRFTAERGSQSRLARELGVSRQAVSKWLTGKAPPSGEMMIRLIAWLRRNQ